jgi:chemotaxis protein histidine kinase CheA
MRHFAFPGKGPRVQGFRLRSGRPLATALLALLFASSAFETADARQYRRHSYREQAQRESAPKSEFKKPVGPLFAVVSLADQHVTFYDANGLYARGLVSTGVPGFATPAGIFTVLEKERYHHSNIYSGAPMPWMQRLAWTGMALHEGAVHPGHTASHGCIRMQAAFAKDLFGVTNIGQRVVISPRDLTPADIVHARLPVPKLQMPPAEAAQEKPTAAKGGRLEPVALELKTEAQAKPINPVEFAKAMKFAAAVKATAAAASKKAAQALLDSKPAEVRLAAREVDIAEDALRRARAELEDATRVAGKAEGEEAQKKAAERKSAAEAKLSAAEAKAREAGEAKAAKDQEVAAAQAAVRDADAAVAQAAAEAKQAVRRMEPVSIFITRKTGRLYVRQATERLFDLPVAIRDPDKPLGTHLFVATQPAGDGASLRWVSLSLPAAAEVHLRHHSSRRGHPAHAGETPEPAPTFPETASGALDRIEIPAEAVRRISELVWTGATLIISDVGMSEGRYPMDFMILQQTVIREWD